MTKGEVNLTTNMSNVSHIDPTDHIRAWHLLQKLASMLHFTSSRPCKLFKNTLRGYSFGVYATAEVRRHQN